MDIVEQLITTTVGVTLIDNDNIVVNHPSTQSSYVTITQGGVSWGQITGKPDIPILPIQIEDVSGLEDALANSGGGADLTNYSQISNLPGYPESFNPSSHNHDDAYYTKSQINTMFEGLPEGFSGSYNDLDDKPDIPSQPADIGAAAEDHSHTIENVTGLQNALDAKQATGDYATNTALNSGLAGKANTSHTHTIANVTNLQTTLDGKAATSHTHTVANVTGLQSILDGKQGATAPISLDINQRAALLKTTSTTQHAATVYQASTTGTGVALNAVSDNVEDSTVYVSGSQDDRGTLKITHNKPSGSDADASALSIDLIGAGTEAKGLFITSTDHAGSGDYAVVRHNTTDYFVVQADGKIGMGGPAGTAPGGKLELFPNDGEAGLVIRSVGGSANLAEFKRSSDGAVRTRIDANAQFVTQQVAFFAGAGVQLGGTSTDFGAGSGVLSIKNASSVPNTDPTDGVIVYAEDGDFKVRTPSGNVLSMASGGGGFEKKGNTDTLEGETEYLLSYTVNDDGTPTASWPNRLEFKFGTNLTGYFNEYGEMRARPAKNGTVGFRSMALSTAPDTQEYFQVSDQSGSGTKLGINKISINAYAPIVITRDSTNVPLVNNFTGTMESNLPNVMETKINGNNAAYLNEWGAVRGTSPYGWGDSLVRAIRTDSDGLGTTGNNNNAFEISDRRTGINKITWGRRWGDGALVRNGIVMADVYVKHESDPIPGDLPANTLIMNIEDE